VSNKDRIDERICVDALVSLLRDARGCCVDEPERPKTEPPDFCVTIDGELSAVEVTKIFGGEKRMRKEEERKKKQKEDRDDGVVKRRRAKRADLESDIQGKAEEKGGVSGTYSLDVDWPTDFAKESKRSKEVCENLTDSAASFIRSTEHSGPGEALTLLRHGSEHVTITKLSREGNVVGLIDLSGEAMWQAEIDEELQDEMRIILEKKREDLITGNVPTQCSRMILVLDDWFCLASPADAQRTLLQTSGHDWFHSILWVSPSDTGRTCELYPHLPARNGTFIYSKNLTWWTPPTAPSP